MLKCLNIIPIDAYMGTFLGQNELSELQAEIEANRALNNERWTAFLNSDPVKHVKGAKWADKQPDSWNSIPLVIIGGLWGTICFDNIDKNFQDLLCSKIGPGSRLDYYTNATSHADVQAEFGTLPVLLNNVECIPLVLSQLDSTGFQNCTSGPMGFEHCKSGNDLKMACGML